MPAPVTVRKATRLEVCVMRLSDGTVEATLTTPAGARPLKGAAVIAAAVKAAIARELLRIGAH